MACGKGGKKSGDKKGKGSK
nr:MAG: hypothetical protein [Bacteriophage sp.]